MSDENPPIAGSSQNILVYMSLIKCSQKLKPFLPTLMCAIELYIWIKVLGLCSMPFREVLQMPNVSDGLGLK
uniref:Uncharacterized protein n=1 Tax=Rhizophora mucronata TaxID=61149 RepID=A0A2P2ILM8_RHIMU